MPEEEEARTGKEHDMKTGTAQAQQVSPWEALETGATAWEDFSSAEQEEVVRHYAPKIRFLALRLKSKLPRSVELGEMISSGTLGLMEALGKFRPQLGIRFETYAENRIRGVILNGCTAMSYPTLARAIEERFSVRACGFLPQMPDCSLESRHLGLITAAEVDDLKEKMQRLAAKARETIDLDALLQIAKSAPPLTFTPPDIPVAGEHVRIGVARDRAFCFYYEDSLELLRRLGAELVPFSPLSDERLPEDLHGLYLGGGYPELYAERLEANAAIRASIRAAVERGLPCVAECGGFMYLTQSIAGHAMAGVLSGSCFDAGKLTRFGYATLTAQRDSMLFAAGEQIPAHEFHRWDAENPGEDFLAEKPSGRSWRCAYAGETLYAGYPHFHFYANLSAAVRFVEACRKEKHRYE